MHYRKFHSGLNIIRIIMSEHILDKSTLSENLKSIPNNQVNYNAHLINTTKILKGHKLKTHDFVKLQLMRFRYCSPIKYEEQIQRNIIDKAKTTSFRDKYRGVQMGDQQNKMNLMAALINEKKQIEVGKRVKLFSDSPEKNIQFPQENIPLKTLFSIKKKPATSQTKRTQKKMKLNRTLSQYQNDTEEGNNQDKSMLQFTSQNLGTIMNKTLNLMLSKPTKQLQNQQNIAKVSLQATFHSQSLRKAIVKDKKSLQPSYIKQMKKRLKSKHQKIRLQDGQSIVYSHQQQNLFRTQQNTVEIKKNKSYYDEKMNYSMQIDMKSLQSSQNPIIKPNMYQKAQKMDGKYDNFQLYNKRK